MNNKHLFDEKQRFSLRKLTVGLASVLVGLTLFGTAQTANSQTVHAATITHEEDGDDVIGEEPALDPSTGKPKHETIDVGYDAQDQDQTIHYQTPDGQPAKDKDGKPVPDGHVTGKTDDMNKDVPMPNGYVPKTPGTDDKTNLTNPNPDTGKVPDKTVTVEHGQHTTAPGETHNVGDQITPNPNDSKDAKVPGNTYQQAITDQDVKKDLTRTVTINKPKADGNTVIGEDGKQHIDLDTETKSSTVSYHRTATVDDVTGKVTGYGNWQLVDPKENQFAGVDVPVVDGYTAHITDGEGHTLSSIAPENAPTTDDAIEHYQSPKIVINYTANNQSVKYVFKDGNSDVLDGTVSGVTGQTVDSKAALAKVIEQLTQKGYDMSKVTIKPYKFSAQNGDITINLAGDHGIIKGVDPNPGGQNPDVSGDKTKIPEGLKDTDGHNVTLDDTRKEITRSITASEPTGDTENARSAKDLSQHGVVTRTFDYDPVTKTITKWNEWRTVSWDAVTVPDHAGYTATITDGDGHTLTSIDKVTTSDPSYKDPKISITYKANSQSRNYVFEDGGTTVVQKAITGVTDQTVDPSTQLDDVMNTLKGKGYDLSKIDLGGNYKFNASNNEGVTIDLSGAHGFKDVKPGDTIPDGVIDPNKSGSDKHVANSDVTETVTRHITFHDPTHENSTSVQDRHADQTVTLKRGFTYDTVTNAVTKYGDWTTQAVPAVEVPKVAGYEVKVTGAALTQDGKIAGDTLRDGYTDPKIEVTYTAEDSTQTIHYVDEHGHELSATDNKDQNGDVIKNSTVTVKTDEVGNVQVPKGWKLVDDHDKTTKVAYGNDGKIPVKNVAITHATIEVTPDKPHKQGEPIDPKVPTGSKYGTGLTSDDLNDVAYREIHFKLPASTNAEDYAKRLKANGLSSAKVEGTDSVVVRQEVAYKRTAIVDAITGEVKGYTPAGVMNKGWVPNAENLVDAVIKNGSAVFNKVLIPQIAGYKAHTGNANVTIMKLANGSHAALSQLFVSFMAIPAPKDGNSTGAVNKEKVKPDDTKPGDTKPDTTPVKDLTKSDQKKIADDTKPGKGDETKPGKTDDTKPGKSDETKPGKGDETKPGMTDDTKPGKGDETKPGKSDETKPAANPDAGKGNPDHKKGNQDHKTAETKPAANPDAGKGTKLGKKAHVSPTLGHNSGANNKNSKITNTAAGGQANKLNRNTSVGNANDEANETNRTVQAAVVNSDKKVLPQTGASQNKIGIIGMVFASLAGMLGLAGTKKKRKND